ncbi:MAG TPA: carbohydrate kinase family protein [Parafilimonas sp.]|nr:carbohydrate kinase family protein [Parafilimonas sp.]
MHKKKFDVLVVGELNIDLILDGLQQFPEIGKEILAKKMTYTLGSSSAIFASNLSTLGVSVNYCGCIGNDDFGKKIINDLDVKGVNTGDIIRSKTATGITVVLNDAQNRAMVTYPGAMNELREADITDAILMNASHVHVSSVFLQPALKPGLTNLFRRAKQLGLTTSLDPQWDAHEQWNCDWNNLLPLVDVFLPNGEELKNIAKKTTIKDAVGAIKKMANVIVVKNSNEGAIVFYKDEVKEQPAFLHHEFADAIGAGDSFDAGFISGFIQDKSLQECVELGAVCGAINTTAYGGTTAFGSLNAVKKMANEKFNYTIK